MLGQAGIFRLGLADAWPSLRMTTKNQTRRQVARISPGPLWLVPSPRYFAKSKPYCRAEPLEVQVVPLPPESYLITPDWSEQNARWPVWPIATGTPCDW